MPINYEQLMALKNLGQKYAYADRDVKLYVLAMASGTSIGFWSSAKAALGCGMCQ
jgi:hypothetical protein